MKEQNNGTAYAMKVSRVSILVNVFLSILKLIAGIISNSGAMVSDAIHSASDVFSTVIVMIGVTISNKKSDEGHQYGHERLECVAAILLAAILLITGVGIGFTGIKSIIAGNYSELKVPGILALIAAVVSITVKEWMFWFTRKAAKVVNSGALMADAWHHRSDALSSVGAFIGIAGARMGYPVLDSVASVVICIFIAKASWDIFKDSIDKLVDKACDDKIVEKMRQIILKQEGVMEIDLLQTRLFGARIYVDIEIAADGEKTLNETHMIAENVHMVIEQAFPEVKHCMVHVNPYIQSN